jgi:ribosome biogenesis GTPase A
MRARGVKKTIRAMVAGIPNVGKSTYINKLFGRAAAVTGDMPGVTRGRQWVKIGPYLELLDTPGMLWPKLGDQNGARILAYLGSVRDRVLDTESLAESLLNALMSITPTATAARFKLNSPQGESAVSLLERACAGRGWLLPGGRLDANRGAALVLDEFRAGKLGKLTLESAV